MRKHAWLLVVAGLTFSSAAFAAPVVTNTSPTDGKIITTDSAVLIDTGAYYADTSAPRQITAAEMQVGNQQAKVRVPVEALLECYLELKFQGNDMNVLEQSFGKGAQVEWNGAGNYLGFYPSVGGYLDGNWATIANSTSINAEVKPMAASESDPAKQTFLRGCDTFKAEAWSNLSYTLSVNVDNGGLKRVGALSTEAVLPIQTRFADYVGVADPGFGAIAAGDWHQATLAAADTQLADAAALQHSVVYQQFRVPYSDAYQAGIYKSNITWTLATP